MAEVIGVVAAALQFAEVTRKAIKLAREIQSGAESGPVHRKITQLETFVEVADKIAQSWTQDDPLTEKILKQCIVTVSALTERLERVDVAETDGLRKKTKKSFIARWEKDDVEDLFRQLGRDQMALLMHRSFSLDRQVFAWERPPWWPCRSHGRIRICLACASPTKLLTDRLVVTWYRRSWTACGSSLIPDSNTRAPRTTTNAASWMPCSSRTRGMIEAPWLPERVTVLRELAVG